MSPLILYSPALWSYNDPEDPDQDPRVRLKKMKRRIWVLLLALLLLPGFARADLEAHFLDVGQGDAAVIVCDGEVLVIDGGPRTASDYVFAYMRETLKVTHIDCVVSTHPHVDHVAGLSSVLNAAPTDLLLTPVTTWDSKSFSNMMKYAARQGTAVSVPQEGDVLNIGGAVVTILHCWPEAVEQGMTNDASIVVRIDYGATSFLFTGDAEEWSEYMMLDGNLPLKADVLKVAHHGSRTATTGVFLSAVRPAYAVISVGKDNGYGHPHREVLNRLQAAGARILRTDESGTVVLVSDGQSVSLAGGG